MKTITTLFLLALTVSLVSCSKSNDVNPSSSSTNKTEQVSGNWTVTYYFDSGKDETSDYSGYSFAFNPDGSLQAMLGSSTFTGTWRIGDSSSSDDSSSNRLVISISGNKEMDHLQDDWLIEKLTDSQISLKDDNISSGEILRFGR
jgi:hypothetical protein